MTNGREERIDLHLMGGSLQKQVFYRLLAAFIASGLVVIAATVWFQSRALEGTARSRQQDITDHFQGRMADLHREWEAQAARLRQVLEFTRILESRRPELLNAFFLTQSSNANFTHAIIIDHRGSLLLQYGVDDEMRTALRRVVKQDPWFYHRAQKTLYHVFTVPVWLGKKESGVLYLLRPIDNALLGQIAYPHTDLYLLLNGQPVASSLGGYGVEQFPGVDGKTLVKGTRYAQVSMPWKDIHLRSALSPLLIIRTQIRDSLSGFEIVLIVLTALAVLALASWLLLGAWIGGIINDIVALKTSSNAFARERQPLATGVLPGSGERGKRVDELGALKTGLASMMQAVIESEQDLRIKNSAIETSINGIAISDMQGIVTYVNKAYATMLGYDSPGEIIGRPITDFSESDQAAETIRASLRASGSWIGETAGRKKDGTLVPRLMSASMVTDADGAPISVLGSFLDITEQKRAEQTLRESEEKFRSIFNNATDGILIADPRTKRFVAANATIGEMLGYGREELARKGVADIHPEEALPYVVECFERSVRGEGNYFDDLPLLRKDGRVFPAEVAVTWINLQGTNFLVGFFRDVTERKQAEHKILAALAEKELLLKEIHHRVKNNLQIIASLLYLQAEEADDPNARELIKESRDRIKSMALVHEKLYSTKDLSRIDFMEYCESLGAYLFNSYGAAVRGIHLETRGSGIFLEVDTAIPCGLIVSELISNALKYAFPGGRQGTVRVTAVRAPEGHLDLTIGDDGIGLPPGLAPERANTLGLRLVHKLAGQLHGRLTAVSGGGAVFHMTIPLQGRKGKDLTNG